MDNYAYGERGQRRTIQMRYCMILRDIALPCDFRGNPE